MEINKSEYVGLIEDNVKWSKYSESTKGTWSIFIQHYK